MSTVSIVVYGTVFLLLLLVLYFLPKKKTPEAPKKKTPEAPKVFIPLAQEKIVMRFSKPKEGEPPAKFCFEQVDDFTVVMREQPYKDYDIRLDHSGWFLWRGGLLLDSQNDYTATADTIKFHSELKDGDAIVLVRLNFEGYYTASN